MLIYPERPDDLRPASGDRGPRGPRPAVVHDGPDPGEQPVVRGLPDDQEPAGGQQAAQRGAGRGHYRAEPVPAGRGRQRGGQSLRVGAGHAAEAQVDDRLAGLEEFGQPARRRPAGRAVQQPVPGDLRAGGPVGGPRHHVGAVRVQHRDRPAAGRAQRIAPAGPRRQREHVAAPAIDLRPGPRAGQGAGRAVGRAVQHAGQPARPGRGRELARGDQRGLRLGHHGGHAEELGQVLAEGQHRVVHHDVRAQLSGRGHAR